MTTIVTISVDQPTDVTSERISEDGRERHPNGVDRVLPGKPRTFIIDNVQSLRLDEVAEISPTGEAE